MAIDWFPGHMLTARRDAEETLRQVDVVIEVLDARVPGSSCNPMIETLRVRQQRPALKILNKADLADPRRTKQWLAHYNAQPGMKAVALSCKNPGEVGRVPEHCRSLAPNRGTQLKRLRMMILGIPNVGKSTLLNAILKRKVAKVGDEPAITKQQKRHDLGPTMAIIDTPGMMWPRVDQTAAVKLAATHSIGRNAYLDQEVAAGLGRYLLQDYPELIAGRFGAPPEGCDGNGLLEWVARRRGFLLKGGAPDLEKAAAMLLQDFRSGALGRVTLETPETFQAAG
jgi:ribosome biogenesis GTPase A